ncbi:MAG: UDP-N-acetylmuramate dehydrogenase [Lactococcus sp.]|jgi:UDP-N-acetylmuramate dehydrogenase|uniref:UDP-N-acetylmuramate dehydrogenase n=1 Tax=Pseudolactococcus carnosus TaxID=2749961 RepID=UPI001FB8D12C|nr:MULTISPECIES: UDP-N-acetylmuramate dehydrogenase [Lactococcus]MBR6896471.1 UDP-N-acetylmuramate dehydrogenase [Lactococcus sp.]MCJ2000874.1 UDP-N-acetylmuramate dehydrogenase [Lactococcus carnosus]MDN5404217.1 UDP-N-acetylmuramate dehydrogenase [Lactococcus sp.]MDN5409374.1 UDP-N-acetylmuramate dehydrogenase [Lactococcus sp.]MDN5412304.1 UDP-N-acetylmuramate dehydrogenase [Lactococcus sp.]
MLTKLEINEKLPDIEIKYDEKLANYTYTKVGGAADFLAFPADKTQLQAIVRLANATQTPFIVLGNASNLIVRDGGIRGIVILLERMDAVRANGYVIEAQAGANLIKTTQLALANSLTGFEFACGIPGSIGGAVFMNAGAYGGEVANILSSVQVMDHTGEFSVISVEDLQFGYRKSLLQSEHYIAISAKFSLSAGDHQLIKAEMDRLTHLRELKQPLEYPSCGSVFKRPVGYFAGQLIQDANLQGHQIGGVQVSKKHAGFMVNLGHGTAKDYEALIADVIVQVEQASGVRLEPEVRILGEETRDA